MLFERGDVYKLLSDHFDVKWNEKTNLCFKDMWKLFYNTDKEGMAEKSLRDYIKNYMQDASCNESLY
jgi:site-specific recombinase XerD